VTGSRFSVPEDDSADHYDRFPTGSPLGGEPGTSGNAGSMSGSRNWWEPVGIESGHMDTPSSRRGESGA
jgi:hypothetical protein